MPSSIFKKFYRDEYRIGLIFEPVSQFIAGPENHFGCIKWLEKPFKKSHMSQAFLIEEPGGHRLVFTYQQSGKSMIYSAEEKSGFDLYHLALASDHKHGFPSCFRDEDLLWCLPYTAGYNGMTLFVFDPESRKLIPAHTLLEGYKALYPMIFKHNQLWWLILYTEQQGNLKELLFWSEDLRGEFRAHPCNDVSDADNGLIPAGQVIVDNGRLIRPMTDYSTNRPVLVLQEITSLSEMDFSHVLFKTIVPPKDVLSGGGIVHLAGNDHYTVISTRQPVFDLKSAFGRNQD